MLITEPTGVYLPKVLLSCRFMKRDFTLQLRLGKNYECKISNPGREKTDAVHKKGQCYQSSTFPENAQQQTFPCHML